MPQQKALQRHSNSSNGQSRLCGVKIMSFPNGELCVKRTGVGGKGRVSHAEGVYNWCPACVGCHCRGRHMQARERGLCACACVREWAYNSSCGHRIKKKNKIRAANSHPLPRWASFSCGEGPDSLCMPLAPNLQDCRTCRKCLVLTRWAQEHLRLHSKQLPGYRSPVSQVRHTTASNTLQALLLWNTGWSRQQLHLDHGSLG